MTEVADASVPWHFVPPDGMLPFARTAWREFYRSCWHSYGIRPADYRAMYLAQQGRCYICRVAKGIHPDDPKARGSRRLGVDHNHAVGNRREAVRGLLCTGSLSADTCNRLIGRYTAVQLKRAVGYLERAPGQAAMAIWEKSEGLPDEARDYHTLNALGLAS